MDGLPCLMFNGVRASCIADLRSLKRLVTAFVTGSSFFSVLVSRLNGFRIFHWSNHIECSYSDFFKNNLVVVVSESVECMWIEKIMTLHSNSSPPNYLVKASTCTIIWKCRLRGCCRQVPFSDVIHASTIARCFWIPCSGFRNSSRTGTQLSAFAQV